MFLLGCEEYMDASLSHRALSAVEAMHAREHWTEAETGEQGRDQGAA